MDKTVRTFLVLTTFQRMATGWFFSTYVLFLLSHGLNLLEVNSLNFIFMSVKFLLNAPTGYLADRLGQRRIFLLGELFWAVSMAVYGLGTTFTLFALAEFLGAIGSALVYGTLESWMRNNIEDEGVVQKAIARSALLSSLATIPSALLGGIIGERLGYQWPWFVASFNSAIVILLTLFLLGKGSSLETVRKPFRRKLGSKIDALPITRREIADVPSRAGKFLVETLKNPSIKYACLVTLVSSAVFQPLNMFWSPIFKDLSGQSWWLGFSWIGISLAISFGSHIAGMTKATLTNLALALLVIGVPLLASQIVQGATDVTVVFRGNPAPIVITIPSILVILVAFFAHEAGRGLLEPILFTFGNRGVGNDNRTTINSIRGTFRDLGAAVGLFVSGALTLWLTPLDVWFLSSIVLILLALWLLVKK